MTSAAVARRPHIAETLSEKSAYDTMDANQLAVIKNTVAKGCSDEEVVWFLEVARSLDLSPWAREVFAGHAEDGNLLIMVGRDGLLRKAEEFPDYLGYDAGVVYENDEFMRGTPDPSAATMRERAGVLHEQGHPKHRGKILGAWAVAERAGRPVRYFYADLDEYMPRLDLDKLEKIAWGKTTAVMIEKVPISVVHRTLCNLSGIYLEEEVKRAQSDQRHGKAPAPTREAAAEQIRDIIKTVAANTEGLEEPDYWAGTMIDAVEALNAQLPWTWTPVTAQMKLSGRDADALKAELTAVLEQLTEELTRAAAEETAAENRAAAEDDPPDAEVVEPRERTSEEELELTSLEASLEDDPNVTDQERMEMEARVGELRKLEDPS